MPGKVPKQAVLYILVPETEYCCEDCAFFTAPEYCAVFGDETVKSCGSCGVFMRGEDCGDIDGAPLTKLQAGYAENEPGFSCKRCGNFEKGNECKVVDKDSEGDTPGEIHPDACCNAWKKGVEQLTKDTPENRKALRAMQPDEYREQIA